MPPNFTNCSSFTTRISSACSASRISRASAFSSVIGAGWIRWISLSSLCMVFLLACSAAPSLTHLTPDALTELPVAADVLAVYPLEDFDRSTEIWCEGTDGEFCPTFRRAEPGESPMVRWDAACRAVSETACYDHGKMYVGLVSRSNDCIGVTIAHELGHVMNLHFEDSFDGNPRHGPVGALMGPTIVADGMCDDDWQLDDVTLKAFHRLQSSR